MAFHFFAIARDAIASGQIGADIHVFRILGVQRFPKLQRLPNMHLGRLWIGGAIEQFCPSRMCASATASFGPDGMIFRADHLPQREFLAGVDERAVDVAQVRIADAILHLADFLIRLRQFALQREIVSGFVGQLIEINLRARSTNSRRAGVDPGRSANRIADF